MLSAAVLMLLYLPLSACACLGSLYVPALMLFLWVSGCRALVVALVGIKRDSVLILALSRSCSCFETECDSVAICVLLRLA